MANFMDKMQVNTAITENTKLDLGHQFLQSADFMQLCPIFTKEMVPGEKIDVNVESFARLNPLPVPTFGRSSMRLRSFFVPYRTVMASWNDFITDAVHVPSTISSVSAIVSQVPQFSNSTLVDAFLSYNAGTVDPTDNDAVDAAMVSNNMVYQPDIVIDPNAAFDIMAVDSSDQIQGVYCFTQKGRQAIKVLESLGYKIAWIKEKAGVTLQFNPNYSALPLLCLARVYVDWYWPTQYTNIATYDNLLSYCRRDNDNNVFVLTAAQVNTILNAVSFVQYDTDYFTAQWDNPVAPAAGNFSTFAFNDVTVPVSGGTSSTRYIGVVSNASGNGAAVNQYNTPILGGDTTTSPGLAGSGILYKFSDYTLTALKALSDYMARNRMVGSKAAERYLARFGKALTSEQLNRSVYLGASMQDIQIGDIMSTSDTASGSTGEQLGAYAGKGISYGNGHFDYDTNEYGMFITVCSIVPKVGYFQGVDRTVKHLSKLDFWTPEFDNLGVQATAADELYLPQQWVSDYNQVNNTIFGYMPRYAEYKTKLDKVVGNFRLPSVNGANPLVPAEFNAANSWYLMRVFDNQDFPNGATDIVHDPSFISGRSDFSQFKRIFYNVSPSAPDNFTVIHNFEIASYSPMKSLFDTYEFEDKGKKVTEDVNGVKMN